MKVLVWGLGYVGTVSAACLAQMGHQVTGIETNKAKVDAINSGNVLLKEPGLQELVRNMVRSGRMRATTDGGPLVAENDISLICVGTPSALDGSVQLDYVTRVTEEIGRGLREPGEYHVVALRSTVFPGTARDILRPILERESGKKAGADFGLAVNPEFLREASAIRDFFAPPYIVVGELDAFSGDAIESLYEGVDAAMHHISLEEAEILKVTNNAFHALKIGFANEIGRICERLGIDGQTVMGLVAADTKLNASAAYLKPGFAFGGSCLPKDLRSITRKSRELGADTPILEAVLPSNKLQIDYARRMVHDLGSQKVGVLGLSFKAETDDLRESPVLDLVRDLWRDGIDVMVYDPDVVLDEMLGSNLDYLQRQLPQIRQVLQPSIRPVLDTCQTLVITQDRPEFADAVQACNGHLAVLDLVRMTQTLPNHSTVLPGPVSVPSSTAMVDADTRLPEGLPVEGGFAGNDTSSYANS